MSNIKMPRILVAFSGGVDSTWVIKVLQIQGHYVEAVHFINGASNNIERCETVARQLNVPLRIINVTILFDHVFDHIRSELSILRMPNPCVFCNKTIKFNYLVKYVLDNGFDYIATGHYAQIHQLSDGSLTIMKGVDLTKDQSYFLNQIDPSMLMHIMFPLGSQMKTQVYENLKSHNINLPESGESYDLCFTDGKDFKTYCRSHFDVDIEGIVTNGSKIMSRINNAELIAINQRIAIPHCGDRMYVANKKIIDDKHCEIIISSEKKNIYTDFHVTNINKFMDRIPIKLEFVLRYHTKSLTGTFDENTSMIHLDSPTYNSGAGQYIVAYHNNCIVFGCMID